MLNNNSYRGQYLFKTILIFLFLLLTVALITAWNTPVTGFEASIYWSTPFIFWVSVISSVIVGIILIVLFIPERAPNCTCLWKIGLLLVFLCYAVILGLFIIRGYYMWGIVSDPASHIGWIKEILTVGYIPHSLVYPITHIYLSEIILLTNLDLGFLHKIVPWIFGLLCVFFLYVLVRAISPNRITPVLATVISCTLTYGWYLNLTPNGLSNLYFPLAILLTYQFLKRNTISRGILLVVVVLLFPVFHPVPAIFLGIIFLTFWIPAKLPDLWRAIRHKRSAFLNFTLFDFKLVMPLIILSIWLVFWIGSFTIWGSTIESTYQTISSEGGPSKITDLVDQISFAQGFGYNVFEVALKQMGGPMILLILSVMSFPLIWKRFSVNQDEKYIFSLYGPFGLLCISIPILYIFNLSFGPLRLVIYASILGTIFTAHLLSHFKLVNHNDPQKLRYVNSFAIVLLVGLFFLGFLNLYPSPYNLTQTYQATQSEVQGMDYFFEYRDVNVPISGITLIPGRFADAFLSPEEKSVQSLPMYLSNQAKAPWHFGYDKFSSLSASYTRETNLITLQKDKVIYSDYYPEIAQHRFIARDFERLNEDPNVSLLYSNGGFDFWNIAAKNTR